MDVVERDCERVEGGYFRTPPALATLVHVFVSVVALLAVGLMVLSTWRVLPH